MPFSGFFLILQWRFNPTKVNVSIPSHFKIFAAPLQGYTSAPWRHAHAELCGAVDSYVSPFVRMEKGAPRRHDLLDVSSELNANHQLTGQVIFADPTEWLTLCKALTEQGCRRIDLNLGCPFPPQMNRGRGAAMVANAEALEAVAALMAREPWAANVEFSLKMRLGREDADEWRQSIDAINRMPLTHVTVHPRVGRQLYRGEPDWDAFALLADRLRHPVVANGNISSAADVARLLERFPQLAGVMIGRALLSRPTLAAEIRAGRSLPEAERIRPLLAIHEAMLSHYRQRLCGPAQVLSKIQSYWDYVEPSPRLDRKVIKALQKASSLQRYLQIVQTIHI